MGGEWDWDVVYEIPEESIRNYVKKPQETKKIIEKTPNKLGKHNKYALDLKIKLLRPLCEFLIWGFASLMVWFRISKIYNKS